MNDTEVRGHKKLTGSAETRPSKTEKGPLISIITVVLNGARYLNESMKSVKDLSYKNIEYIIIDGGSSDGTVDIIKQNELFVDYWVSEPDSGVYDAMNKALDVSHGDYILFLGADDCLCDVFHEMVNVFDDDMVSYYGNVQLSDDSSLYAGRFTALKLFGRNIPHQAILYSRHVFDDYRYELKYLAVADYALNLKVFSDKRFQFKYIPKTVAVYNNVDGFSSNYRDEAFSIDKPEIIKQHYSFFQYGTYMLLKLLNKTKNSIGLLLVNLKKHDE